MTYKEERKSGAISLAHVFSLLEGTWQGEGKGEYPTINSFDYRETLLFERIDAGSLHYVQRTNKFVEGRPVPSHWESGFMEILEGNTLRLSNVQGGGRGETLTGRLEEDGDEIRLLFKSRSLANDARMVATTRMFALSGDTLRYEMEMATTSVADLTFHVAAALSRVTT